jgi:hypothetical protein
MIRNVGHPQPSPPARHHHLHTRPGHHHPRRTRPTPPRPSTPRPMRRAQPRPHHHHPRRPTPHHLPNPTPRIEHPPRHDFRRSESLLIRASPAPYRHG